MTVLHVDEAGLVFGSGHLRVVALDDVSLAVDEREYREASLLFGNGNCLLGE